MKKRGFITMAFGEYYYYLAINLLNSYLITNQQTKYSFAVITDLKGKEKLGLCFDDVIVCEPHENAFEAKLEIASLSPYDETIFIDADTLITRDISFWWDLFVNSGEDVSVFENSSSYSNVAKPLQSDKAVEKYKLDRYLRFNGGVYYFKNSDKSKAIFNRAKELLKSYEEDELPLFGDKPGDEPVMEIALIENGVYGVSTDNNSHMYCTPGMTYVDIDIIGNYCHCVKHGADLYPSAMHFGTSYTFGLTYRREVLKMKMYLNNLFFLSNIVVRLYGIIFRLYHKGKGFFANAKH